MNKYVTAIGLLFIVIEQGHAQELKSLYYKKLNCPECDYPLNQRATWNLWFADELNFGNEKPELRVSALINLIGKDKTAVQRTISFSGRSFVKWLTKEGS